MDVGYRIEPFFPDSFYHIYSRGVEQRDIFQDDGDRYRFIALLTHCLPRGTIRSFSIAKRLGQQPKFTKQGEGLVDILCYCLMSNHFHLLLKENEEGGISAYMQRLLNGYARYFNVRHQRIGPLFAGPFRAVGVEGDDSFLHVTRYVHLNPYAAGVTQDPFSYRWSSLGEYIGKSKRLVCHTKLLSEIMQPKEYKSFVADYADFSRELSTIKHLLIEEEEETHARIASK